jgi:hypothetical protein
MKIVIFGLAKSGTTALFYILKRSLPSRTVCMFEPRSFDARAVRRKPIRSFFKGNREPNVLAKVLPFRPNDPADAESFCHFEKQIFIIRDPRDRIISRLLYGIYDSNFFDDDRKVTTFLEMLKQKESDSSSVSVKDLLAAFAALNGEIFSFDDWARSYRQKSIDKPLDFHEQHADLFLFKYEAMIDQRLDHLAQYLGLTIHGPVSVAPELNRVTRTKNYGDWRNWFTTEDVESLRPVLQSFLDRYYPQADWELSASPSIAAAHGSLYIQRIVNDRRAIMKRPAFAPIL